jgi:hypothetical protein
VTAASLWFCQFSKTVKQTAQRTVSIFAVIRVRLILAAKVLKLSVIKELYHKKKSNTRLDAAPFIYAVNQCLLRLKPLDKGLA